MLLSKFPIFLLITILINFTWADEQFGKFRFTVSPLILRVYEQFVPDNSYQNNSSPIIHPRNNSSQDSSTPYNSSPQCKLYLE